MKQEGPDWFSNRSDVWLGGPPVQIVLSRVGEPLNKRVSFLRFTGVLCFSELFFIKEPHDAIAVRREAVILDCHAKGESPIDVRWLKNGAKVAESDRVYLLSNGSLYISEVESRRGDKSDEGLYQCLAQNKYGAILSQRARLTIASKSLRVWLLARLSLGVRKESRRGREGPLVC